MTRGVAVAASLLALIAFFASGERPPPERPAPASSETAAVAESAESLPPSEPVVRVSSRFAGQIIDVHTHFHPARLDAAFALMKREGVAQAVNLLPIPFSERDWPLVLKMEQRAEVAGVRLHHFVSPPWQSLRDAPDAFGEVMADNLEAAVGAGARGLKIAKALGLALPAPEGGLLPVDDPRLDPLWKRAGTLHVPVAIHIGDPVAFWEPLTPANERYDELKVNPHWSNFERPVPSHAELMAQQKRLFARHPKTTFIAVHVAGYPEDLTWVSALLDGFPNVNVDLAARIPALGHHPVAQVRAFFERHQDRIVFGTDLGISPEGIMLGAPLAWRETPKDVTRFFSSTWRYLESTDQDFAHPTPIQGRWTINGLGLSDAVLTKVYSANARRLLRLPDE